MCCCLVDCVKHWTRNNQVLFIGLLDAMLWIAIACLIAGKTYTEDNSAILYHFEVYHDKETAQRLYRQHKEELVEALILEVSMLAIMVVLDVLLIISPYWRRPCIALLWCIGMVVTGMVRIGTLIYYYETHFYLLWDKFYWILGVSWILMLIDYFKELMEENNPKLELHLPYVRAVGPDSIIDENVPEMHNDDQKGPRPEYFVLGYTNDLNVNTSVNRWEGVDYFGKIHHFVNERSCYHV